MVALPGYFYIHINREEDIEEQGPDKNRPGQPRDVTQQAGLNTSPRSYSFFPYLVFWGLCDNDGFIDILVFG